MKALLISSLLLLSVQLSFTQIESYYVKPILTDPNYANNEDSSTICRNLNFHQNKLYLFIGGTGSSSSNSYIGLMEHAAELGFDFINLSYPNNVAAASMAHDSDSLAFNKYRQELCFGTAVSSDVTIDSLNSIYRRTLNLLIYLDQNYPTQNWGQYLNGTNELNWSKFILGGHSQGSGHACYLAKQYGVDRVLMFSGPNDYSDFYGRSANWLRQPGETAIRRHFSYLSLNDEAVDYSKQYANIEGLGLLENDDSTHIDGLSAPYNNTRCLYTTQAPGFVLINHNVPVKQSSINEDVWTYMLTDPITANTSTLGSMEARIHPNPFNDVIRIEGLQENKERMYYIYNSQGKTLQSGILTADIISTTNLEKGYYILKIENNLFRIVKN